MTVYGITTCRQTQKSIAWFKKKNIEFIFHDYKKIGISLEKLQEWEVKIGYDFFLNKKGMTWKKLDEGIKVRIKTSTDALLLMVQFPNIIKRPGIEGNNLLYFGFDEQVYETMFLK